MRPSRRIEILMACRSGAGGYILQEERRELVSEGLLSGTRDGLVLTLDGRIACDEYEAWIQDIRTRVGTETEGES